MSARIPRKRSTASRLVLLGAAFLAVVGALLLSLPLSTIFPSFRPEPFPQIVADLPKGETISTAFEQRVRERFPLGSQASRLVEELQGEGFALSNGRDGELYLRFDRRAGFPVTQFFIVVAKMDTGGVLTDTRTIVAATGP